VRALPLPDERACPFGPPPEIEELLQRKVEIRRQDSSRIPPPQHTKTINHTSQQRSSRTRKDPPTRPDIKSKGLYEGVDWPVKIQERTSGGG
jgi:hypothetical protein